MSPADQLAAARRAGQDDGLSMLAQLRGVTSAQKRSHVARDVTAESFAPLPDYVAVAVVAEVCGVSAYALETRYRPCHWGVPRELRMVGAHVVYAVAALPELADELGERGLSAEAGRLRAWWMARSQNLTPPPAALPQPAAPLAWYQKGQFE